MRFNAPILSIFFTIGSIFISCDSSKRGNDPKEIKGGLELLSSKQTGVIFNNSITESKTINHIYYNQIYSGSGIAIGDLNNDGLPDTEESQNGTDP